jgi:transposase InsO family protein
MPFIEVSKMDSIRSMVALVQSGAISVTAAAEEFGVTRKVVYHWLAKAQTLGIENLSYASRAPKSVPNRTDQEIINMLLALKKEFPVWGARKLTTILERDFEVKISERTANRHLEKAGLVKARIKQSVQRFERESPNLLYQMDFKGLPKKLPFALLTVIDDASRMCLHFAPIKDKTRESVLAALWKMFEETGLPESVLMDNGDCWGTHTRRCPTTFEAQLWKLGIRTTHGRPGHPQTQGKVERFHRTAKEEMGEALLCNDVDTFRQSCEAFRTRYNWVRPHDALGQDVPGLHYKPSQRLRPDSMPAPATIPGLIVRRVQDTGHFSFEGKFYKVGKGLAYEPIQIEIQNQTLIIHFAGQYVTQMERR